MKKNIKKIINRLEKNEYNKFESNIIINYCDRSLFKYYPLFCTKESTWTDLITNLSSEEKIIDINIIRISGILWTQSSKMICFTSNKGNYFLYKSKIIDFFNECKKLHSRFNLSEIKELDFIIHPDYMFSLNKGVPGLTKIFFDNKKELRIAGCYSRFAENMKCYLENTNPEEGFRQPEWIKEKIDQLNKKKKISQDKYKLLLKRLKISTAQANRLTYESIHYEK